MYVYLIRVRKLHHYMLFSYYKPCKYCASLKNCYSLRSIISVTHFILSQYKVSTRYESEGVVVFFIKGNINDTNLFLENFIIILFILHIYIFKGNINIINSSFCKTFPVKIKLYAYFTYYKNAQFMSKLCAHFFFLHHNN